MIRNLQFLFVFLLSLTLNAQENSKSTEQFLKQIDEKIPQLLNDFLVPGAAIAIIEDGEVIFQKGYGFADIEKKTKITEKTGFNVGSISKSVAAWGVMKLVQEGKIELDTPVEKYLTRWHFPESEFDSDGVTVRRLLSHTAGTSLHSVSAGPPYDNLPTLEDWLNGKNDGLERVEIILEPGNNYKYSGGGYGVLQLLIEEVTGQKFEEYMQTQILNPLGMTNSSYKIDDKILAASATPYNKYGDVSDYELFTAQAGAGLHTTLEDLTRYAIASFHQHKDNKKYNPVLSPNLIQEMMKPVLPEKGHWLWGMGYQTEKRGDSFTFSGHGGSNTGWQANFRVNPETNDGFVVLTNGGSGYSISNQMMCDWVHWKTGKSLGNWCKPKPTIAHKMKQIIDQKGIDNLGSIYTELRENQPDNFDFSEGQLNDLGYFFVGKKDLETALKIFKINVDAFPYAYNVYDSYGEALLANGSKEEAIENYKKSVQLNPDNEHGIKVLKDLGEPTDDLLFRVPIEHLKRLEGEYLGTHDETWRISVEVNDGVLKCEDKYYNFTLVPIGDDKFVNPRFGALWRFDTSNPDADPALFFGKREFKRIKSKSRKQFLSEIDEKMPQLLNDFLVPGAAIGIIDNGEIILQKGYGLSDVEKGTKVDTKTGFNIGSISKNIAAWGVMKLVQEGKLDLDAPAEKYLTRWHLPKSEFDSDGVTIRRMLSHTAGLSLHGYPGWSPNDTLSTIEESLNGRNNGPGRVEIIMAPGTRHKYSGGGYTIMQLIIEEVTGQNFEDFMQTEVLNPIGMTNSSYKIDDKIMAASSSEYDKYGEETDFELFTAQAAAGLHVTIEDFTRFALANLYQMEGNENYNPVLRPSTIEEMMEADPLVQGRYGYGLGYFVEEIPGTSVIMNGHRGANTGWHAIYTVNPETNDGFIMITNSGSGHHVYSTILYDWTLWKLGVKLEDWHNEKPSITNKLKSVIDSKGIEEIGMVYKELKENHPDKYDFSEGKLNHFAHYYQEKGDLEKAMGIFKLNVETFPKSFKAYENYGAALLENGEREHAIENYKKSVVINPGNDNAIKVLNELGVSADDLMVKVPVEHLKLLTGEYIMTYDQSWSLVLEIENGELVCRDGNYKFWVLPVGQNEFVNTDDAGSLVFNTEDEDAITLLLLDKYKFRKTGPKKPGIARKLLNIIDSTGMENIAATYWDLRNNQSEKYDFHELELNSLGYHFINEGDLEKAKTILKLNMEAFPNAFNTYDSYGELLLMQGAKEEGIESYKKSIELNPGNEHGKKILNDLGVSTDDLIFQVPDEHLNTLVGEYTNTNDASWKLVFEVEDGELVGNDGEYKFRLLPIGANEFIFPKGGDSCVFDSSNQNAMTLVFSGKYTFKKN